MEAGRVSRKPGKTMVVGQSEVLQPTRGERAEHLKSQVTLSQKTEVGRCYQSEQLLGTAKRRSLRLAAQVRSSRRRFEIASPDTAANDNG